MRVKDAKASLAPSKGGVAVQQAFFAFSAASSASPSPFPPGEFQVLITHPGKRRVKKDFIHYSKNIQKHFRKLSETWRWFPWKTINQFTELPSSAWFILLFDKQVTLLPVDVSSLPLQSKPGKIFWINVSFSPPNKSGFSLILQTILHKGTRNWFTAVLFSRYLRRLFLYLFEANFKKKCSVKIIFNCTRSFFCEMVAKPDGNKTTVPFNFITKTGFFRINSTTTHLRTNKNRRGWQVRGRACVHVCAFTNPVKKNGECVCVPPPPERKRLRVSIVVLTMKRNGGGKSRGIQRFTWERKYVSWTFR